LPRAAVPNLGVITPQGVKQDFSLDKDQAIFFVLWTL